MPAPASCPISEIDKVLSPYVNSNQDTHKIRSILLRYLNTHVKTTNSTSLAHLDQGCPHNSSLISSGSSILTESRMSYVKALQAQTTAQERHRELQASLSDLQASHIAETPAQINLPYDIEATRGYISLLHQRRRFLELQVIQDSLDILLTAKPIDSHKDPKMFVREAVGEQPDLPVERLEQLSQSQENDTSMFGLKKEVLEAKDCMDRAQAGRNRVKAEPQGNPSLRQQVYALGCARDEIVAWVEAELAKMNEDSILIEDTSPMKQFPQDATIMDVDNHEDNIGDSYQRYTASRSALIDVHGSIQDPTSLSEDYIETRRGTQSAYEEIEPPNSAGTIIKLLPRLPDLIRVSNDKRALLQQDLYVQRQLSSADEEIAEAMLRLSQESHLLPSGSRKIKAWGNIATETEAATEGYVLQQLQKSHQEVSSIKTVVELCSLQSNILAST